MVFLASNVMKSEDLANLAEILTAQKGSAVHFK